jgi:hypothetical protein
MQLVATNPDLFTFRDSPGAAAPTVGVALLHVPLYLAVGVFYVAQARRTDRLRRRGCGVDLRVWIGPRFTAVPAFVLMALMSIPRNTGRRTSTRWPWSGRRSCDGLGVAADQPGLHAVARGCARLTRPATTGPSTAPSTSSTPNTVNAVTRANAIPITRSAAPGRSPPAGG